MIFLTIHVSTRMSQQNCNNSCSYAVTDMASDVVNVILIIILLFYTVVADTR